MTKISTSKLLWLIYKDKMDSLSDNDFLKNYIYRYGSTRASDTFSKKEWTDALREHFPDIGVQSEGPSLAPNLQILQSFSDEDEPNTLYRSLLLLREPEYAKKEASLGEDKEWENIFSDDELKHVRSYLEDKKKLEKSPKLRDPVKSTSREKTFLSFPGESVSDKRVLNFTPRNKNRFSGSLSPTS